MPYHRIPNCELGQFGNRHGINIFFPSLYTENRTSSRLTSAERAALYDKGLRPAINELLPLDRNDWPANYEGEMFRAGNHGGGVSYQTKEVSSLVVGLLVGQIRMEMEMNEVGWGHDAFVIHMVRGTKASTKHNISREAAEFALGEYLESMDLRRDDSDFWYIDVGIEISSEKNHCLQWLTTSHCHLLQKVLEISERDAARISTLGSSKYSRDISSHLPQLSGCRVEPGLRARGNFRVAYYQQYTSEKALTYNPGKGFHGKTIQMKEAMGKKQPCDFISKLYETYIGAKSDNASSARIEVRVPVKELVSHDDDGNPIYSDSGTVVMTNIPAGMLRRSLASYSRDTWW